MYFLGIFIIKLVCPKYIPIKIRIIPTKELRPIFSESSKYPHKTAKAGIK